MKAEKVCDPRSVSRCQQRFYVLWRSVLVQMFGRVPEQLVLVNLEIEDCFKTIPEGVEQTFRFNRRLFLQQFHTAFHLKIILFKF